MTTMSDEEDEILLDTLLSSEDEHSSSNELHVSLKEEVQLNKSPSNAYEAVTKEDPTDHPSPASLAHTSGSSSKGTPKSSNVDEHHQLPTLESSPTRSFVGRSLLISGASSHDEGFSLASAEDKQEPIIAAAPSYSFGYDGDESDESNKADNFDNEFTDDDEVDILKRNGLFRGPSSSSANDSDADAGTDEGVKMDKVENDSKDCEDTSDDDVDEDSDMQESDLEGDATISSESEDYEAEKTQDTQDHTVEDASTKEGEDSSTEEEEDGTEESEDSEEGGLLIVPADTDEGEDGEDGELIPPASPKDAHGDGHRATWAVLTPPRNSGEGLASSFLSNASGVSTEAREFLTNGKVYVRDNAHVWLPARVLEYHPDHAIVSVELQPGWEQSTFSSKASDNVLSTENLNKREANQLALEYEIDPATLQKVMFKDYNNGHLPLQNPSAGGSTGKRDMADLVELHSAAILYNLKDRHYLHQPYTRVGDIVIAMNPFEWIDGMYSTETRDLYSKNLIWEARHEVKADATDFAEQQNLYDRLGFEPHVYEVSSLAYRGLATDGQDQTILVTGESGAGKTETVKIVMSHLATVQQTRPGGVSSEHSTAKNIVNRVCTSSPVFEAFGNAKTIRNYNSSRFGKFLELHFSLEPAAVAKQAGRIVPYTDLVGSSCVTYLLEKSRVVSHDPGERSYHIFYQLLASPKEFKEELWPAFSDCTVEDFTYLAEGGGDAVAGKSSYDDDELWATTKKALEVFKFEGEALLDLMRALVIVLQLGNLSFGDDPSDLEEFNTVITSQSELELLSQLSGIDSDQLEKTMTTRKLKTRGQDDIVVKLSPQVAKESCDALAKEIYGRIFDLLVRRINEYTETSTVNSGHGRLGKISLLDIFGFECFETNRFEQLCINYANEQLHNKYILDNFEQVKDEYELEGVDLYDFALIDNSDVLDILEGRNGLITSLTEECFLPKGNAESFIFKAKTVHQLSSRLINKKLHQKTEFGIVHFAGPVTYDANSFLERNIDKLPDGLVECATKTANPFIRREFQALLAMQDELATGGAAATKKRTHQTVIEKFRIQVKSLMAAMEGTKTRYIRCIKPNPQMLPRQTHHETTLRQLEYSGLSTALTIARESFPDKLPYDFLLKRYSCLMREKDIRAIEGMEETKDKVEYLLTRWLKSIARKNRDGTFSMPFACGKTMVYLKTGSQERLENLRMEYFEKAAIVIQTVTRMTLAVRYLSRALSSTLVIQKFALMSVDRLAYKRKRQGAIQIEAWVRARRAVAVVKAMRQEKAAVNIQSQCRGYIVAREFRRSRVAAKVIQKAYRLTNQRSALPEQLEAFVKQSEIDLKLMGITKKAATNEGDRMEILRDVEDIFASLRCEISTLREQRGELQRKLGDAENSRRESPPPTAESVVSDEAAAARYQNQIEDLTKANDILSKDVFKHRQEATTTRRSFQTKNLQINHKLTVAESECKRLAALRDAEKKTFAKALKDAHKSGSEGKHKLQNELKKLKDKHTTQVQELKDELKKTQESHEEYLNKLMTVIEKTAKQRERESKKIKKELDTITKQKEREIDSLKSELDKLRTFHDIKAGKPPKLPTLGRTHLLRKRLERNSDARARRSAQFDDVIQTMTSVMGIKGITSLETNATATVTLNQDNAESISDMIDMLTDLYRQEEGSQTWKDEASLELIDEYISRSEPEKATYDLQRRLEYSGNEIDSLKLEIDKMSTKMSKMCPQCKELNSAVDGDSIIYDDDPIIYG